MNKDEQAQTIERYRNRLKEFGYSQKALGWNKGRANLRFEVFIQQWDLHNCRVLDFGCGFGDFFYYLQQKGVSVEYTGIDINPHLIEAGRSVYPDINLICGDLFEIDIPEVDFSFASGVFNYKLEDTFGFIKKCFNRLDAISKRGFASNFLSDRVEYQLSDTYHTSPIEMLALAYQYSNRITLRNDYMPFEFSVFVDKVSGFSKELAVYEDFEKYV